MADDRQPTRFALVHADESCLGNARDRDTPGGAASLIEVESQGRIARRDLFISSPATTNNRMALAGAIATFALLSERARRWSVAYVSDSQYLVKGMREWLPGWRARGWRRKAGPVENLQLWQQLERVTRAHEVDWVWVRGHAGHPKNEYVNDLAITAARAQRHSAGAVASGFEDWLRGRRERGALEDYDPDQAFTEARAAAGYPR